MSRKKPQDQEELQPGLQAQKKGGKRAYRKPAMTTLGRAVDVTHGPSLGSQESGNPAFLKA